jgi:hypothetical protein
MPASLMRAASPAALVGKNRNLREPTALCNALPCAMLVSGHTLVAMHTRPMVDGLRLAQQIPGTDT